MKIEEYLEGLNFEKFQTKTDMVFKVLRNRIIVGELNPGEKLFPKKVAQELEISETPVREGLQRLESVGLVEISPHKTAYVSNPPPEKVMEKLEIRAILQPKAALWSAPLLTKKDIEKIEEIHLSMKKGKSELTILEFLNLGYKFHEKIYSKCPNKSLLELIGELKSKTLFAKRRFLLSSNVMDWSFSEHEKLLEALKNKDFEEVFRIEYHHQLRTIDEFRCLVEKLTGENS